MERITPFVVGISGGTGSGKTTLAKKIIDTVGDTHVSLLEADSYYADLSHVTPEKRHHINFDHPDALDVSLLVEHVTQLKEGRSIQKHIYDFKTHTRTHETITIDPKPVVVVEGILIFAVEDISRLLDLKVFIDVEADVRLLRRIIRDVRERGRSVESVAEQYLNIVRPMHAEFVEPSKMIADIVINNEASLDEIIERIKAEISGNEKANHEHRTKII